MAKKGKDPAFLFYSKDFITGTIFMSDEQVGMYIKALAISHTKGGKLTEKEIKKIVNDDEVLSKFKIDDEGFYYNERLLEEIESRQEKAKVNRENGKKGGNPNLVKGKPNPYYQKDKQTVMLEDNRNDNQKINIALENANEDVNVIKDKDLNEDFNNACKYIIEYLNNKLNTKYSYKSKATRDLIKARFNENRTIEDFIYVIDVMYEKWHGDNKMEQYLRPATLFSNKFESYINMKRDINKAMNDYMLEEYKKTGELL